MRRHDNWLELADRLGMPRTYVVAICFFLNKNWSAARVAKALGAPLGDVNRIAGEANPLLRKPRRQAKSIIEFLKNRDGAHCHYCKSERSRLTIDHIVPKSRGGTNDPENLVLACTSCNSAKGDRTPEEWLS